MIYNFQRFLRQLHVTPQLSWRHLTINATRRENINPHKWSGKPWISVFRKQGKINNVFYTQKEPGLSQPLHKRRRVLLSLSLFGPPCWTMFGARVPMFSGISLTAVFKQNGGRLERRSKTGSASNRSRIVHRGVKNVSAEGNRQSKVSFCRFMIQLFYVVVVKGSVNKTFYVTTFKLWKIISNFLHAWSWAYILQVF